jgi:hypothetical protein
MHGLQSAVRIRRQRPEQGLETGLQRGAGTRTAHGPLQSDGQGDLPECLAVSVRAVIHCVHQFVGERIDDFVCGAQGRGNEDVVRVVRGTLPGPALPDGDRARLTR